MPYWKRTGDGHSLQKWLFLVASSWHLIKPPAGGGGFTGG